MSCIEDVIVRRATPKDHYAIVINGDLNSGRDYVPAIYQQVVNDPEVYPVVAELKGQVVGFMMDHVIDGGLSVVRRAVRTFSPYKNMGIMHKMSKVLDSLTEERFPDLRYRYESVAACGENSAVDNFHLKDFTEIHRKRIIHLNYRTDEIIGLDAKDELLVVMSLEYDDVKTIFTLDDLLEQLFPLKRIFNFFIGYRCLESNIKHVLSDDREVCVTIKTPCHTHDDTTKPSLLQDIDLVSFTFRHMGGAGLVYGIDIYAKEANNASSLRAHILRHLRVLKELNLCDKGVLVMSICRNVCEDTVRSLLRQCGIVERAQIADNWSVLLQKKIESKKKKILMTDKELII